MTTHKYRILLTAAVAAATMLAGLTVRADDTELLVGPVVTPPTNPPNILFVLDTSGSMDSAVTGIYDPAVTYTGACTDDKIYWRRNTGTAPDCGTDAWVYRTAFTCDAAMADLNTRGVTGSTLRAAQWRIRTPSPNRWENIRTDQHSTPNWVECRNDAGVHGNGIDTTKLYAANNSSSSSTRGPWNASSGNQIDWSSNNTDRNYLFYTANYLNWYYGPTGVSTRMAVMQQVLNQVLDGLTGVNVGLMRYSNNDGEGDSDEDDLAQGGMVVSAMADIDSGTHRQDLKDEINSWSPWGMTPLTETLWEGFQYLRGGAVTYGNDSRVSPNSGDEFPSIAGSRQSSNANAYESPLDNSCQKTFLVFLTDGLPTSDLDADDRIEGLIGGTCNGSGQGRCLDELSSYMFRNNANPDASGQRDLRSDVAGNQNVTSYWIGFGEIANGATLLEAAANAGGGEFFGAEDTAQLVDSLTEVVDKILLDSTSFTSPTVAVNAFNRTQNLNALYMSVFKPGDQYRWLGNIKKYKISAQGVILDADNQPAVDASTGFFLTGARSFWTTGDDGPRAESGGAASKLISPSTRKIYSNLTSESGLLTDEELSDLNSDPLLANTLLLGVADAAVQVGRPAPADLINWAYGVDVYDADGDSNTTEARADMGDPLHARPGAVIYDGPATNPDLTLYATTNDGALHAIDATADPNVTTVGGNELWAFMPRQLLGRIEQLIDTETVAARSYGLDSAVEVLRLDRNGNGEIEPAGTDIDESGTIEDDEKDKVYVYFGMRRGGSHYYGLDVTNRSAPKLMWRIGDADAYLLTTDPGYLPGIGQTWSTPTVARVNVDGHSFTNNPDKFVLVFGGGYDTTQDQVNWAADAVGRGVYMVDAVSGELLWRAGPDAGADLTLNTAPNSMTNAIPGEVRVVDLSGDGFGDRMYAADLGGRVWRFDIRNGEDPDTLVQGGVFASVGMGDDSDHLPNSGNRRFFNAPDVSFIKSDGRTWINVAIGSGHREKPVTDSTVENWFYSLRDYNMFTRVANNQYKTTCGSTETSPCHQIITHTDPVNISANITTDVPVGGPGWRLFMPRSGEKVLAESRTFQNRIFFTSFEPSVISTNPATCSTRLGINRLFIVDAATGDPVENFDTSTAGPTSVNDRWRELTQRGTISPEAIFIFPTPDPDPDDPNAPVPAVPPLCLVGLESCGTGLANPPVRTYWQQRGAN